jgi:hypothetical protein
MIWNPVMPCGRRGDVFDRAALRFALNARPTASQGEAPASAIENMKILEEQQIGENIVGFGLAGLSDQGPLNPDRRQRLHKLLDRTAAMSVTLTPAASAPRANSSARSNAVLPSPAAYCRSASE